jgi:hypothetical protein
MILDTLQAHQTMAHFKCLGSMWGMDDWHMSPMAKKQRGEEPKETKRRFPRIFC